MSKIVLNDIVGGYDLSKVNENFQLIEDELNNKALYRANPVGEPNSMSNDLDMNGYKLLNVSSLEVTDSFTVGGVDLAAQVALAQQAAVDAEASRDAAVIDTNAIKTATEAIYDGYDDRELGAKAVDPTTDNDGNPLLEGAQYWNTQSKIKRVWNGTTWENVTPAGNMAKKTYVAGGVEDANTFIPGTTTTLTLPTDPLVKANVDVVFDTSWQQQTEFNISGTTLTFTAPIPVGVAQVEVSYTTPLQISTPADGAVTETKLATAVWDSVNKVVTSISALKAIDKTRNTKVFVSGYYAQGDGGGGYYYYDAADTTSADNGGTIIVATDGGRWKLVREGAINLKQFGMKGDGSTADNAAFSAALTSHPNAAFYLPDGDYLINNASGAFTVSNFAGELVFGGRARLVFNTNTKAGVAFSGGTGARIRGMRVTYSVAPPTRVGAQEAIAFYGTTDTAVENIYVENSPAAGLLFNSCIRPKASNVTILMSKADGTHFANCQDGEIVNLTTVDTGDDGLAFVNYVSGPNNTGGLATNIRIRNSKARGISVVGQSDVVISNFEIDGTSASGSYTAYESLYSTRVPENVVWSNGLIKNAGTVTPLVGNQYGIEYSAVTSVTYNDIKVVSSANRGMSGTTGSGTVEANNITVDSPAASSGFNLSASTLMVDGLTARNTKSYGIYIANCTTLIAKNFTAINCSVTDALQRAVGLENNAVLTVSGVNIIDTQATATGFKFLLAGTQAGLVTNLFANIANGSFAYDGSFPNIAITNQRIKAMLVNYGSLIGSRVTGYATAAPTSGTFAVGDRVFNSTPTVGQPKSWVCTAAGTPGTWVSEGNL